MTNRLSFLEDMDKLNTNLWSVTGFILLTSKSLLCFFHTLRYHIHESLCSTLMFLFYEGGNLIGLHFSRLLNHFYPFHMIDLNVELSPHISSEWCPGHFLARSGFFLRWANHKMRQQWWAPFFLSNPVSADVSQETV